MGPRHCSPGTRQPQPPSAGRCPRGSGSSSLQGRCVQAPASSPCPGSSVITVSRVHVSGLRCPYRVRGACPGPGVLTASCAPSRAIPCCAVACAVPTWGPCGWRGPNTSRHGLGGHTLGLSPTLPAAFKGFWKARGPRAAGSACEGAGRAQACLRGAEGRPVGGHGPAPSHPPACETARFWRWLCSHVGSWVAAAWQVGSCGRGGDQARQGPRRPPLWHTVPPWVLGARGTRCGVWRPGMKAVCKGRRRSGSRAGPCVQEGSRGQAGCVGVLRPSGPALCQPWRQMAGKRAEPPRTAPLGGRRRQVAAWDRRAGDRDAPGDGWGRGGGDRPAASVPDQGPVVSSPASPGILTFHGSTFPPDGHVRGRVSRGCLRRRAARSPCTRGARDARPLTSFPRTFWLKVSSPSSRPLSARLVSVAKDWLRLGCPAPRINGACARAWLPLLRVTPAGWRRRSACGLLG